MRKETFKKQVEAIIMKQVKVDIPEENLNDEFNDLSIGNAIDILIDTIKVSKVKNVNVILSKSFKDNDSIIYNAKYILYFGYEIKYTITKSLIISFYD